jgi:hypothetical protein
MKKKCFAFLGFSLFLCPAWGDDDDHHHARLPTDATFSTLILTTIAIEGLTGDDAGNLYTTGRRAGVDLQNCPVWRVSAADPSPQLVEVGFVPAIGTTPCSPSGITFNDAGDLFISDGSRVHTLTPNAVTKPTASVYATDVPGTNGLAFDRGGNLWTGDGTTGQGRVWKIAPGGGVGTEMFRVQPMRNGTSLGGNLAGEGVGRQARTFPPGTLTISVPASATATTVTPAGGQDLVANGIAFNQEGDMFIADTARGAIWKVEFDHHGNLKSRTGCDSTFSANTLCLDNVFVAHPLLEGTDGIALDRTGNIWNSANERNAIVVVTKQRRVVEIFRNPPNAAGLRNSADPAVGNNRILETPTSPFLLGHKFCTANSDGNRRDNSPNTVGEIKPAGPIGKISCMDQPLRIPGLRLPL